VKTLGLKRIKNDILLSYAKLHKMSIITHSSEQKKLSKKYMQKNPEKWQLRRQNRPEWGKLIGFGLGFPQGSTKRPLREPQFALCYPRAGGPMGVTTP
jgi:hypothetical protein